ncbi:MAG: hypothetical protein WC389_17310 [Lutibacter sp.]|jgi:hypothetical protein
MVKCLKTKAEIKELCDVLQNYGISIIPTGKDKFLKITIDDAVNFSRPSEAGLLVFIPDSLNVWQKWLGEFHASLQGKNKNAK